MYLVVAARRRPSPYTAERARPGEAVAGARVCRHEGRRRAAATTVAPPRLRLAVVRRSSAGSAGVHREHVLVSFLAVTTVLSIA